MLENILPCSFYILNKGFKISISSSLYVIMMEFNSIVVEFALRFNIMHSITYNLSDTDDCFVYTESTLLCI